MSHEMPCDLLKLGVGGDRMKSEDTAESRRNLRQTPPTGRLSIPEMPRYFGEMSSPLRNVAPHLPHRLSPVLIPKWYSRTSWWGSQAGRPSASQRARIRFASSNCIAQIYGNDTPKGSDCR